MSARAQFLQTLNVRQKPLLAFGGNTWSADQLQRVPLDSTVVEVNEMFAAVRLTGDVRTQLSALFHIWRRRRAPVLLPPHWMASQVDSVVASLRTAPAPNVDDDPATDQAYICGMEGETLTIELTVTDLSFPAKSVTETLEVTMALDPIDEKPCAAL